MEVCKLKSFSFLRQAVVQEMLHLQVKETLITLYLTFSLVLHLEKKRANDTHSSYSCRLPCLTPCLVKNVLMGIFLSHYWLTI